MAARALLLALPLCVGLVACSGSDTTPTDVPPATDTEPPPTGETGLRPLDPEFFIPLAFFAYDENTQTAVGYTDSSTGSTVNWRPTMWILLFSEDAFSVGFTPETSCLVALESPDDLTRSAWEPTVGAWVGFEMPANKTVTTDCMNLADRWGADPSTQIASWAWGFGINDMDPDTLQQIEDNSDPVEFAAEEPYFIGGGAYTDALDGWITQGGEPIAPDSYAANGTANASEVDDSFVVQVDALGDPVRLLAVDVQQVGGVATGQYSVSGTIAGPAFEMLMQ